MRESNTQGRHGQVHQTLDAFLRARVRELIEEVLQEEVTATLGRTRSARETDGRGYRHGSRARALTLTAGTVAITVPRRGRSW